MHTAAELKSGLEVAKGMQTLRKHRLLPNTSLQGSQGEEFRRD